MMNLFRALAALAFAISASAASAQSPRLAPERHGAITAPDVSLNAVGTPSIDSSLRINPPSAGVFRLSGWGTEYSVCPQTGCDQERDILLTQMYLRGQSKWDVTHAETQVAVDNIINTGKVPTWATSTAYSVGTIVANNNKLFKVRLAGTSASTGSGPTVVDPLNRGIDVTDGTITWTYISGQDDTDNKATFSLSTYVGANASRTWGFVTNMFVDPSYSGQTAIASEEDMTILRPGDCNPTINCFLKFLYANGPGTGTAILQISSTGSVTPIGNGGTTGGATKYGISIDGINTVRDITIVDGTHSLFGYKNFGNHAAAVWQDVGTSPVGIDLAGTYGTAAIRSNSFALGRWSGNTSYSAWSLNGDLTAGTMLGCFGAAADRGFYCNTPAGAGAHYEWRIGAATQLQLDATQLRSYQPVHAPSFVGDAGTAAVGLDLGGTYTTADVRSGDLLIGPWNGSDYKGLSLNGSLGTGTMAGLFGKASDNGIYVVAPTFVEIRPSAVTALQITASKVQSYVPTYHYAVGALPSSPVEGDCAWDSAVHKLKCYDGTIWNAAW